MDRHDKFSPPVFNLDLVPRRALVARLRRSVEGNLVSLMTAPTGCGKSALLAQLREDLARTGQDTLWYACDHFDSDAGRFVSMLQRAIGGSHDPSPGGRSAIEALLTADDPKGLADAVAARGRRLVLFLDNVHLCDSDETAEALDVLIREARGMIHVVMSARRCPRFALGQLRLRGLVGDFDAADLAFSPEEAQELIGEAGDASAIGRVIERTEGWAAGLQLVRLLVAAGGDLRALARDFSGADQDLGPYLNEEVFRTLPPALREFLLRIAPLDRICAELAVAVTGDDGAARHFEDIQARNLFVMKLDRQGRLIRLHAMFRDFLVRQAARLDSGLGGRSLGRAAHWHRERGDWIEAIDYALRAGDEAQAAAWLEEGAPEILTRQGETARFLRCADRLADGAVPRPGIAFWRVWAALFSGDHERAGQLMDAQAGAIAAAGQGAGSTGLLRFLVAYFNHRHVDALALGRQWLEEGGGEGAFDRATVRVALALCHRSQLDMEAARRHLELAREDIALAPTSYGLAWVAAMAAQFLLMEGRAPAACAEIEDMLARTQPSDMMRASAELVLADACYERDALERARSLIRRNLGSIAQHGNIDVALGGWRVAARLALIDEGPAAALDLLRRVEHLSIRRFGLPALRLVHLLRDEIILDLGPEARRRLEVPGPIDEGAALAEEDPPETREARRLLRAKRHLVSGQPRRAIADVLPILAAARAGGRLRLFTRAACVKAAAHFADGETGFALRTLTEALECAAGLGLKRSILDHAALLRPVAASLVRQGGGAGLSPEAFALVEALAPGAAPAEDEHAGVAPAAPIALSRKESRVLTMVSQGLTNGEITERLFVSLPTVKWHMRNIFTKLDVRTRTAAVARARALGMLH